MNGCPRHHYLTLVRGERQGLSATLGRLALTAASWPYGAVIGARNWLFDHGWLGVTKVPVPVVSVGNLTVGGTGKTPCVEYIAAHYRERGLRVAILSRGYGAEMGPNDEALVLEENLSDVPHLQGPDRVALAGTAVEELESEILVLDDGFQHRWLTRDLDLVLLDATCPWGHGHLLPRGLLRERPRGLRRAHAVLLTRCDQAAAEQLGGLRAAVRRLAPGAALIETRHRAVELLDTAGQTSPLETLTEMPVAAFCGLGNPGAFQRTLVSLGVRVQDFRAYPDHHAFTRTDVDDLDRWAAALHPETVVVTTQKDLVKLRIERLGGRPLWCLRVRLEIETGREELHRLLDALGPEPT
jgi:tetraacyldisaccharide 4'-kinase